MICQLFQLRFEFKHQLICFISPLVPRVSTDGSPHEILTLVACLSGAIVATIVVSVIIFVLRKANQGEVILMRPLPSNIDVESQIPIDLPGPSTSTGGSTDRPKMKIFTIFRPSGSFDLN